MRPHRFGFHFAMILLVLLAGCAPGSAPPPPDAGPGAADTPVSTTVLIQHQATPADLPDQHSAGVGDQDSSGTADQKRAPGGDRFTFGQFERPFNADTMDAYFPYLDIQDASIYQDDTWAYAVITVKGRDASNGMPGRYAVELDLNQDGRGDWLILANHPASTDWTTDGVQVWADKNGDVGGAIVVKADNTTGGDGYETQVFDQGHGDDADLAWARLPADAPNTVQLAVKRTLLGSDQAYLAGMWAGIDDLNPVLFDLNDHFTHDQAGAAMKDLEYYYPIKQLSELDNTCRMAIGFEPVGNEPGLCSSLVPLQPGNSGSCAAYAMSCSAGKQCCDNVPCINGTCHYP
jgi:hypothetical protein